jgi:hypothetical protein
MLLAASVPPAGNLHAGETPTPAFIAEFLPSSDPTAAKIQRTGDHAISWLGSKLVREVGSKTDVGDPEGSISACHLTSLPKEGVPIPTMPDITAVKYTSLRITNPDNAPDPADRLALDRVKQAIDRGEPPRDALVQRITHAGGAVEWRVYRPLAALPSCLQCHGRERARAPALAAEIERRFPEAEARDYTSGEWRGLIRVSVSDTKTDS